MTCSAAFAACSRDPAIPVIVRVFLPCGVDGLVATRSVADAVADEGTFSGLLLKDPEVPAGSPVTVR